MNRNLLGSIGITIGMIGAYLIFGYVPTLSGFEKYSPNEPFVFAPIEYVEASESNDYTMTIKNRFIEEVTIMKESCDNNRLERLVGIDSTIAKLDAYCLLDNTDKLLTQEGYKNLAVSKGEFIELIAKVVVLQTGDKDTTFFEYVYHDKKSEFVDVKRDSWYTPYVYYAYDAGLLEGAYSNGLFKKHLEPVRSLKRRDFEMILKNAGKYSKYTPGESYVNSSYITRGELIERIGKQFESTLIGYEYAYGDTPSFVTGLISSLQGKTQEEQISIIALIKDSIDQHGAEYIRTNKSLSKPGLLSVIGE